MHKPFRPLRYVGAVACLVAVSWHAPAVAQLQLADPNIPAGLSERHIAALEGQMARRHSAIDPNDPARATVLRAQRNVRRIARRLWTVAARDGLDGEGALAGLYALTLTRRVDAIDRLTADLPDRVGAALAAEPQDAKRLASLARQVAAVHQFNRRVDERLADLETSDASAVDGYLQHLLGPLAVVAAEAGDAPRPMWPAAGDGDLRGMDAAAIAALRRRIDDAALAEQTREQLHWQAEMMGRAVDEPDLRPRVATMLGRVRRLLDVAAAVHRSDALGGALQTDINQQVHEAAMLLGDPATRDAAARLLDGLARLQRLVELVDAAAATEELPTATLQRAVATIHRLNGTPTTAAHAEAISDVVQRLVATALARRAAPSVELPLDIRRVRQVLARRYAATERQLLTALGDLLAQPGAATTAVWTEPLRQLRSLHAQLVRLDAIPGWVQAMSRFNPQASRGLYQQARLIADDLLDPGLHAGAAAALSAMERQLELFRQLPHEQALADGEPRMQRFLAADREALLRQITILRSQWAAAWSAGADPTPAGEKLLLVRRLLTALHDLGAGQEPARRLARLNRWAAWEAEDAATRPAHDELPDRVRRASQQAAAGQWEALGQSLDALDRRAPLMRLVVALDGRLGAPLAAAPGGVAGLLGECLFEPGPEAYAADQRLPLARLCMYLAAAEQARRINDPAVAGDLTEHAAVLARQVLEQIDRSADVTLTPRADSTALRAIDL